MSGDQLMSILFLIICFFTVYMSFFYVRKDRFLNTDDFAIFRDGLFTPIINFWLMKTFMVVGSLFITYFGILLVVREFR